MKHTADWIRNHAGILVISAFFIIHISIINAYGFTWDFHFHFFGGGKLLGISPEILEPRALPFVEPDPRLAWTLPYGPLMSIPPVASYLLLYKTLALLPPDAAYHLPIVLWGVSGIAVLYLFIKEAINRRAALLSAVFLGLTPRYFGDLHNNMKDVPSAVAFALNIWLLWRLVKHKRLIDLLLAVVAFAVAFNVKINSIFIPVVFITWLAVLYLTRTKIRIFHSVIPYVLTAPLAAFLLWWVFWPDPIGQLRHAFLTFGVGTNNIEVLLNGTWYCSGSTVPWYYPYWYLAITTPIPVLIGFIMGIAAVRRKQNNYTPTILLTLLWLMLPLTRYVFPSIGVIDGIRHFEEVVFPIAALSAIGTDYFLSLISKRYVRFLIMLSAVSFLLYTAISFHPYQIAYFNEFVGGPSGAMGKYDLDYWGTSQKAAVLWVNDHAPQHAKVHIVMAAAVAGQYLRPDLIANLNKYGYDESDFVILLNRQSFFYRFFYAYEYLLYHRPAHVISVRGAPLTWIYDNRTDNKTPRQTPWWQDEDPCIRKYWKGER